MGLPRIVVADDFKAFADACKSLLEPDFDVVATVHSGDAALEAVRDQDPDILVLDVSMPGMSAIDLTREIARVGARAKVVMLSFHRHPAIIEQAFAAGALGYVSKVRMARDLLPAVRAALTGETFRSPGP